MLVVSLLVAALVGLSAVILIFGGHLIPAPGGPPNPPLAISVEPWSFYASPLPPSPGAAQPQSATCLLPATDTVPPDDVAENESKVVVTLSIPSWATAVSTVIEFAPQHIGSKAYAACSPLLPRYTGVPKGWQTVQLSKGASRAPIPFLTVTPSAPPFPIQRDSLTIREFHVVVLPPRNRTSAAIEYTWQISIIYKGRLGSGSAHSDWFASIAPPG
jgi:hypothetical protein